MDAGRVALDTDQSASRAKVWLRRYLPCEIVGTVGELGGAIVAYAATDSLAIAAVVGTVGAAVGYYAIAYVAAVRLLFRSSPDRRLAVRVAVANLLALRSVLVEFGPAEAVDSLAVRPLMYYFGPALIGSTVGGWIVAKIVADIAFYLCAIVSFEKCERLVVRATP